MFSLWRKARRENSAASRLLGSTSLRFALHGWQRVISAGLEPSSCVSRFTSRLRTSRPKYCTQEPLMRNPEPDAAPVVSMITGFPGTGSTRMGSDSVPDRSLKRVFGLVIDFGTSQSPKSTRPLTTYWCPSRPGHPALRNNFASSLLLRTWLPMTGRRVWMPTLLPLWRYAHDG